MPNLPSSAGEAAPGATSAAIDRLLARVLRGERAPWPNAWGRRPRAEGAGLLGQRIAYHGVASILAARTELLHRWPKAALAGIRAEATAAAMWELRHRGEVCALVAVLDRSGVEALLLKGTALAYSLYDNPAWRTRGDTDLLIRSQARSAARRVLAELDFRPCQGDGLPERYKLQESWTRQAPDGTRHVIDLHFEPFNAPALRGVAGFDSASVKPLVLARLGASAAAPDVAFLLFHACLHRALHDCAPYFAGGKTYYGGDRLIWLLDIDLLVRSMPLRSWDRFIELARSGKVAQTCLAGLKRAEAVIGTPLPAAVVESLARAGCPSRYFRHGQLGRAWCDVGALAGFANKAGYVRARLLPGHNFLRAKYPGMASSPLALLHVRRLAELMLPRRAGGASG